jgi:ABC-2 type transport system ATP-binding protein
MLLHSGHALYCDTPHALKQQMPGALISIQSPNGRAVRAAITAQPGVSHVILVGDGVHAVVDDPNRRIPQLRDVLERANVPHSEVAITTPSIEDVFVALLETGGGT